MPWEKRGKFQEPSFPVRGFIDFYERELAAAGGGLPEEELPGGIRIARDRLRAQKKAICADMAQRGFPGESIFRRTLAHSDTPETEFAILENRPEQVCMWLMYGAEFTFTKNYKSIMEWSYTGDLTMGNNGTDTLRILKNETVSFVFDARELITLELSARRIVESLLSDFVHAALYADEPDESRYMTTIDDRFLHMIPDNLKPDYLGAKKQVNAHHEWTGLRACAQQEPTRRCQYEPFPQATDLRVETA